MAMETWSSPINNTRQKPEGEGWAVTGYRSVRRAANPNRMGSGFTTVQVPIYSRSAPAPAPPPPPPAPAPTTEPSQVQDPTPLDVNQPGQNTSPYQSQIDDLLRVISQMGTQQPQAPVINIEPPKSTFSASTAVDGNATGFTRAKSAAKRAGLTNKGASRLRINRTGQTSASSGLNIGV